MLFLGILLLPLVSTTENELLVDQFRINLNDGVLRNVLPNGNGPVEPYLNIAGLGIREIDRQAFDNLSDLESLNLANNSLVTLPEFIFANLTKLRKLSLAENRIYNLENALVGLQNLKVLNLSYTSVRHLRRGHLFSLPETVQIVSRGNIFQTLSNVAFDNPFLKNDAESLEYERKRFDFSRVQTWDVNLGPEDIRDMHSLKAHPLRETPVHLRKDLRLKLCAEDGVVSGLEELEKDEILSEKCIEVPVDHEKRRVVLKGLGIEDFDRDWYRLQKLRILELDLSKNDISEITSDILNDLPGDLASVNLMGNQIKRIKRHVIENEHLKMLILNNNGIEEIQEGAFELTKLTGLFLSENNVKSLNFGKTLPLSLSELSISSNRIKSIPKDAFSKLSNLVYLNLRENGIEELGKDAFLGLRSLSVLDITKNLLTRMEPGCFRGLHSLNVLNLYRNSILTLEKGTFEGLASLLTLNLAWNKLQNITKTSFVDLPMSLESLYLDFNEIQHLQTGSFIAVPRTTLSLDGNRLSSIPKVAFDLPFLQNLHLHNNTLKAIDADAYIRIPYLKKLWLGDNRIETIEKGATRNLGYLSILDISRNPIKRLENGMFYGLPKYRGHFVYFGENKIECIQGGVFEDYINY